MPWAVLVATAQLTAAVAIAIFTPPQRQYLGMLLWSSSVPPPPTPSYATDYCHFDDEYNIICIESSKKMLSKLFNGPYHLGKDYNMVNNIIRYRSLRALKKIRFTTEKMKFFPLLMLPTKHLCLVSFCPLCHPKC